MLTERASHCTGVSKSEQTPTIRKTPLMKRKKALHPFHVLEEDSYLNKNDRSDTHRGEGG